MAEALVEAFGQLGVQDESVEDQVHTVRRARELLHDVDNRLAHRIDHNVTARSYTRRAAAHHHNNHRLNSFVAELFNGTPGMAVCLESGRLGTVEALADVGYLMENVIAATNNAYDFVHLVHNAHDQQRLRPLNVYFGEVGHMCLERAWGEDLIGAVYVDPGTWAVNRQGTSMVDIVRRVLAAGVLLPRAVLVLQPTLSNVAEGERERQLADLRDAVHEAADAAGHRVVSYTHVRGTIATYVVRLGPA